MDTRPVWRWPYTWPKQNLSEMLKEIIAGTFSSNTESAFTRNWEMEREVLIQCRERGLCSFPAYDDNAHTVLREYFTLIPQPEQPQRGGH